MVSSRRGRVGEVQVKQFPIEKEAMFAEKVIDLGGIVSSTLETSSMKNGEYEVRYKIY